MTALDFPSSPSNGQPYGSYYYDSAKGAWRSNPASAMAAVPSPTPPTNPVAGNLWLNTNDGVLFVYYNDGDTAQWVEVKANSSLGSTIPPRVDALETANATTNKSGLVPIVPTSVVVGSGSASVNSNGLITLTNVNSLKLDALPSGYKNFRIVSNMSASATAGMWLQFMKNGTVYSANYYGATTYVTYTGSTGVQSARNNSSDAFVSFVAAGSQTMAFIELRLNGAPMVSTNGYGGNGDASWNGGYRTASVSDATGFSIISDSTSVYLSGTLQVYGYR